VERSIEASMLDHAARRNQSRDAGGSGVPF
jgi:hypothetical protein